MKVLLSFIILSIVAVSMASTTSGNETLNKLSQIKLVISKRTPTNMNETINDNSTDKWFIGSNDITNLTMNNRQSNNTKSSRPVSVHLFKSIVYKVPLNDLLFNISNTSTSSNETTSITFSLVKSLINNVLNGSNINKLNETIRSNTNRNITSLLIFPILLKTNSSSSLNSSHVEHLKEILNNRLLMRKNSSVDTTGIDTVYHFKIESYERYNSSENIKVNNMSVNPKLPVLRLVYIQQLVCFV